METNIVPPKRDDLPNGCVMTLKDLTDLIGVRHDKAMLKIAGLQKEEGFGSLSILDIQYKSGKNTTQTIQTYNLTKKQAIAVGARLSPALLMKVINRLEELESKNRSTALILPNFEDPAESAIAWAKEYKEKQRAIASAVEHKKIAESRGEVIKNVVHSANSYTPTQVAKDLEPGISAKMMNKMLKESMVIFKENGTWTLYAKYQNYGLASIKETDPDIKGRTFKSLRWSAIGKDWVKKNWRTVLQRVTPLTLAEWEVYTTRAIPKIPTPDKKHRNFD